MVSALGYSSTTFEPHNPGRLCRGRERWIDPWDDDADEAPDLHRLVITGGAFSDDSAADALRGLHHSGFDVATILTTVFARKTLVAFMEDGHPADIPEGAQGVELYTGHRAGGRSEGLFVRWCKDVSGMREVRELLGPDPEADRVRGFFVLDADTELTEELIERIFVLVGMSTLDSPPARFQPAALPELLQHVRAIVLMHRDKHGPALGIYSLEPLRAEARLISLCDRAGSLIVRFAIPPMLARWDRALAEARREWESRREEPFPVPAAPEASTWEPRRRGRRDAWQREAQGAGAPEAGEADPRDLDEEGERDEFEGDDVDGDELGDDLFDDEGGEE
jgi:hypothetical protein